MRRFTILSAVGGLTIFAAAALGVSRDDGAHAATELTRGWNNVAYMGTTRPPTEALTTIDGKYAAVYRWDAATQEYLLYAPGLPAYATTLTELKTGDAIWVNLTADSGTLPSAGNSQVGPSSGRIAVPASSFSPMSDLALYEKSFNQINPVGTDEHSRRYIAAVNLPDGVTISSMTAHYEATGGDVQVRLDYTPLANGNTANQIYKLVEVLSTDGASPRTVSAFTHTVDNGANVYFLVVDLTGGPGTKLRGVSIAYTG